MTNLAGAKMSYSDLVAYKFWDETSQFDTHPSRRWVGGCEYYEREFTVYIPARLIRRRPDLIDEFIDRNEGRSWLYSR